MKHIARITVKKAECEFDLGKWLKGFWADLWALMMENLGKEPVEE